MSVESVRPSNRLTLCAPAGEPEGARLQDRLGVCKFSRDGGGAKDIDSPLRLASPEKQFRQRDRRDAVSWIRLVDGFADGERAFAPPMSHEEPCGRQQKLSRVLVHLLVR